MRALLVTLAVLGACSSGSGVRIATTEATEPVAAPGATSSAPPTSEPAPTTTSVAGTTRIEGNPSAAQVAAELTSVEQAAGRGDATVGVRQQLLYRYLAAHPELDGA